jgi:hypothetical protein
MIPLALGLFAAWYASPSKASELPRRSLASRCCCSGSGRHGIQKGHLTSVQQLSDFPL